MLVYLWQLLHAPRSTRESVLIVAALNLAYFGIEFAVAVAIGSVSLFADSIDFLEDASVNSLVLVGLWWPTRARAALGMVSAGILLAPSAATLWTAWEKFANPAPPSAAALSVTGLGALFVNLTCALILARHRCAGGSLTRAAFLSARNDVIANVAIIFAGWVTAFVWRSAYPDLLVGLGSMGGLLSGEARAPPRLTRRRSATVALATGWVQKNGFLRKIFHAEEFSSLSSPARQQYQGPFLTHRLRFIPETWVTLSARKGFRLVRACMSRGRSSPDHSP